MARPSSSRRESWAEGASAEGPEIVAGHARRVAADAVRPTRRTWNPQAHHGRRDRPGLPRRPRTTSSPASAPAGTSRPSARCSGRAGPSCRSSPSKPELSPVLSGGNPGPHPIQGIGAGFVPGQLPRRRRHRSRPGGGPDAFKYAQRAAREEGLLIGVSSGAVLAAGPRSCPRSRTARGSWPSPTTPGSGTCPFPGLFDIEPEAVAVS